MDKYFRIGLIVAGALSLALAVGFFFGAPWATNLWLWQDSRLSYIFVSSILAAIGIPVIWIGWSGEFAAAQGGALDLALTDAGAAIFLFQLSRDTGEPRLFIGSIAFAILFFVSVGVYLWSRRYSTTDTRALPPLVRFSFAAFAAVLIVAGSLLILRIPNIFPWPLKPNSSVLYGLIFWGAAVYFIHAILHPKWNYGAGQLAGFLAYDLILIGPFLAHFATVLPEHRTSLVIYTAVLIYSGGLAIYYLFINKSTQLWKPRA